VSWLRAVLAWFGLALPPWLLPNVIAGAFVASLGTAYVKGRVDASTNCRAAALAAENAQLKRDRDEAISAERHSDNLAAALAAANQKLQQENDAYGKELELRPDIRARMHELMKLDTLRLVHVE
jgi:hypothetical protein